MYFVELGSPSSSLDRVNQNEVNFLSIEQASKLDIKYIIEEFGRLDLEENENPREEFKYIGLLDVYSYCLSEEEASELLTSFEGHQLKYEKNFKDFFIKTFHWAQEMPVYIHMSTFWGEDFNKLKPSHFNGYHLSKAEKKKVVQLLTYKTNTFKVSTIQELLLFVMLSTREIWLPIFFFPGIETAILGNFELSFPVYSKHQDAYIQLEKLAEESGIYIR